LSYCLIRAAVARSEDKERRLFPPTKDGTDLFPPPITLRGTTRKLKKLKIPHHDTRLKNRHDFRLPGTIPYCLDTVENEICIYARDSQGLILYDVTFKKVK